MRDFIFFLNTLIVILTIILHLIHNGGGLQAQLVVAFFQLTIALAYTLAAFRDRATRFINLLGLYWLLVLAYFILVSIADTSKLLLVVLPMSIACYFVYVTYCVSKVETNSKC